MSPSNPAVGSVVRPCPCLCMQACFNGCSSASHVHVHQECGRTLSLKLQLSMCRAKTAAPLRSTCKGVHAVHIDSLPLIPFFACACDFNHLHDLQARRDHSAQWAERHAQGHGKGKEQCLHREAAVQCTEAIASCTRRREITIPARAGSHIQPQRDGRKPC